ncbi:hypothetical protein ILYODFUR_003692 [Ilyodon furcidens]|uniref:Uncharacterized protein n=1 Tax=Ilyodon furcidens TaxID=33524 RepID=A0ABV0STZ2_9TELE
MWTTVRAIKRRKHLETKWSPEGMDGSDRHLQILAQPECDCFKSLASLSTPFVFNVDTLVFMTGLMFGGLFLCILTDFLFSEGGRLGLLPDSCKVMAYLNNLYLVSNRKQN